MCRWAKYIRAMNHKSATIPPNVPPMIAPRLGVRETTDPPDVAVGDAEWDVVDIVLLVVEVVVVEVVVVVVLLGKVVVGVLSGIVSCEEPDGPMPTKNVVEEDWDIHKRVTTRTTGFT